MCDSLCQFAGLLSDTWRARRARTHRNVVVQQLENRNGRVAEK